MNRPIVCNCSLYDFTHTLSTKCRGQPYAGITKHDRLHPEVDTVESANPYGWEPEPLEPTLPPLAPRWATVRWPSHPSDVLKLLSGVQDVEK